MPVKHASVGGELSQIEWEAAGSHEGYKVTDTLAGGDWIADGNLYYGDVDITAINSRDVIIQCRQTSDNIVHRPSRMGTTSAINVRVWMPTNSISLEVVVLG